MPWAISTHSVKDFFKKLLVFGIILTLLFVPFSPLMPVPVAEAKVCVAANAASGGSQTIPDDQPCPNGMYEEAPADASSCSFNGPAGLGNCLSGLIYIFTVGLGSAVAFVAAMFLNFAVHLSLDSGAYALDFVATGWTTARDIANMAFIFILIYLAVTIMFQAQTAHSMQTLAGVVVIALIINFSFFFTRLVIDAGNILSVQFYNAIVAQAPPPNPALYVIPVPDITASIMNGIDLQTALNSDSFRSFASATNDDWGKFIPYVIAMSFVFISVGAMLFMLAATFLTAGVKFLIRIVVLWFMIIASPLALAARASGMKQFEHYYYEWQSNLIKHAFYPVAFLFVFWILAQFMNGAGTGGYLSNLFAGLNAGPDTNFIYTVGLTIAELAIRLGFVIAILYLGIRAADRFGTIGAGWAQNFGQRFSLGGLNGYRKGVAWAGNRFAARPAAALVSQPLGGAATLGNNLLKKSGALNGRGMGGAIARATSRNVLQPLTKTSIAGEKSYSKLMADARERDKGDKNRAALSEAIKFSDKLLKDPTNEERENYEKQRNAYKKELAKLGADKFLGVTDDQLVQLTNVGIIDEAINKKIHDSPDFSEDTKHNVEHALDENRDREQIKVLNEINTKLGELSAKTGEGEIKLRDLLNTGMKLDKKNTGILKTTFQQKLDEAQVSHKEAESRLQAAISMQTEAKKAGDAGAKRAAENMIKGAKEQMVAAKTIERSAKEAVSKLEKQPKKEEKPDTH